MNEEELSRLLSTYIEERIEKGGEFENPKIDFKRQWYDLSSNDGKNEFLKDSCAIANTFGPDGYIIIGFDPSDNSYHEATLNNSNVNDESIIQGIVVKKVDHAFNFEIRDLVLNEHSISVIHIFPSFDKPHVIRNYRDQEHCVFVRSGTTTRRASKHDFELMSWDRKNIRPEYELWILFSHPALNYREGFLNLDLTISIENLGFRPVNILDFKLVLEYPNFTSPQGMNFLPEDVFNLMARNYNIIIETGEIKIHRIEFQNEHNYGFNGNRPGWNHFSDIFSQNKSNINVSPKSRIKLSTGELIKFKILNKNGLSNN